MCTVLTKLTKTISGQKSSEMSEWFRLFADLDPLANPDSVGRGRGRADGGCWDTKKKKIFIVNLLYCFYAVE